MMHLLMLAGCTAGMCALAAATERQQALWFGRLLSARSTRWLRATGWLLLLLCLAGAVRGWGWSFGLVAYTGHTSLAAGLVYLGLILGAREGRSGAR
ncbi:DUF3325 domain-containing protein [Comamonas endophytica]|uniref:DUF3325 domain-containing protein n=1 Tax=Comamonas endophytica TaxID=2949090 RepID=A0ABY6GGJ9_9BURK|nr:MULTISPECIES: DUF3325 domain-containing protein [unclassified Acidovorax]MCD2513199.1 DUF3325 domain-containing protein [Acidovorax sp. D4N7]UYG53455.1 DUF3325 domain-containing protein [Acidovorax sp. 5MLIR]